MIESKIFSFENFNLTKKNTLAGNQSIYFKYSQTSDKYFLENEHPGPSNVNVGISLKTLKIDLETIFSRCNWLSFKILKIFFGKSKKILL